MNVGSAPALYHPHGPIFDEWKSAGLLATGNAQSQHLRTLLPAEIISSRRGTRISFIKQNLDLTSRNGVC